jgi:hypothetical protein
VRFHPYTRTDQIRTGNSSAPARISRRRRPPRIGSRSPITHLMLQLAAERLAEHAIRLIPVLRASNRASSAWTDV